MKNWKKALAMGLSLSMLAGSPACAEGTVYEGPEEPVTLTFWNGFTGTDGEVLVDIVNTYNETNDKKYVFKWSLIASIAGLAFNVIADPIVGYFYKQYILGQPQEVASILAKLSAGATFVNAIVSTILVVIIYNAVRPALIKTNLIHVHVAAANAK